MASVNMETANGTVQLATMEDLKAMQTSIGNSMGGRLVETACVSVPTNRSSKVVHLENNVDYIILKSMQISTSSYSASSFNKIECIVYKGCTGYMYNAISESDMNSTLIVEFNLLGDTVAITGRNEAGNTKYDNINIEAYSYT